MTGNQTYNGDMEIRQTGREKTVKRAKARAMNFLNKMGRTESQLREKLLQGDYPEDVIDEVLDYVKSFGYVDDENYAESFILGRKERKSRWELWMLLEQKGVAPEVIDRAFESCYNSEDTEAAIRGLMRKRKYDPETADRKETQKFMNYLVRKGFQCDDIRAVFSASNA